MDQFAEMLKYFAICMTDPETARVEAIANTVQARLIQDVKEIAQCF